MTAAHPVKAVRDAIKERKNERNKREIIRHGPFKRR